MTLTIKHGFIYLADLNPKLGTEPGKVRPALVLQTNLLNNIHPSTIVCPLTTKVEKKANYLRVHLKKGQGGLSKDSDVMIDLIRAIDNRRFVKKLGKAPPPIMKRVYQNVAIVLDLSQAGRWLEREGGKS